MRCKLFGHKWDLYKEDIQHITSVGAKLNLPIFMGKSVSIITLEKKLIGKIANCLKKKVDKRN